MTSKANGLKRVLDNTMSAIQRNDESQLTRYQRNKFRLAKLYFSEATVDPDVIEKAKRLYRQGVLFPKIVQMLGTKRIFALRIIDVYAIMFVAYKNGELQQRSIVADVAGQFPELSLLGFCHLVQLWRSGRANSAAFTYFSTKEIQVVDSLLLSFRRRAEENAVERDHFNRLRQKIVEGMPSGTGVVSDADNSDAIDLSATTSSLIFNESADNKYYVGESYLSDHRRKHREALGLESAKSAGRTRPVKVEGVSNAATAATPAKSPRTKRRGARITASSGSDVPGDRSPEVDAQLPASPVSELAQPHVPKNPHLEVISSEETVEEALHIDSILSSAPHTVDVTEPDCTELPGTIISDRRKNDILSTLFD